MGKKRKTSRGSQSGTSVKPVKDYDRGRGLIWGGNGGVLDEIQIERDYPEQDIPYSLAVDCILTALDGLWFTSDDPVLEDLVNDHLQQAKQKIQREL